MDLVQEIDTDLNIDHTNYEKKINNKISQWTTDSTRELIRMYSKYEEKFSLVSQGEKHLIWQEIALRFSQLGYHYCADTCHNKWRNLKMAYKTNKERASKYGLDNVKWCFYKDMDNFIRGPIKENSVTYEVITVYLNEVKSDDHYINTNVNDHVIVENNDENDYTDEKKIDSKRSEWTTDTTRELMQMYSRYGEQFSSAGRGEKHLIWKKIAIRFSQLGYHYSANTCHSKWRNLKMAYKKSKERASKYGLDNVKWCFYKDMDNLIRGAIKKTPDLNKVITVPLYEVKKHNHINTNADNLVNVENIDKKDNTGSSKVWTDAATKCFIKLLGLYRPRFLMASQERKRLLWNEISDQLHKNGHCYSGLMCNHKWRLLIANYLKRKEKYKKKGVYKVKWKYYQDLDRLLGAPIETNERKINKIRRWKTDTTRELIRMYSRYGEQFSSVSRGEKYLLWKKIAFRFLHLGYHYSAKTCHSKWRNLKMAYKKNKDRASKYGLDNVKWCYYKDMDNIIKGPIKKIPDINKVITVSLNEVEKYNHINTDANNLVNVENIDKKDNTGSSKIWTDAATKCFIKLLGLYRPRFLMASHERKRLLWNEISDQLLKNGHCYSGLMCNRKWFLLNAYYLKQKAKYKKKGVYKVKWKYYQDFERILGPPIKKVSWSMDSTVCLIDCFNHHKEKLMLIASGKKLLVWKQISEEMAHYGFFYSPKDCLSKWCQLKCYYKKKKLCSNKNKRVWVFYDKMDSVLRDVIKEKIPRNIETNNDTNNRACETNKLDENNYIKTKPNSCSFRTETITELKNSRFKEMKDDNSCKEKNMVVELQQKILNAFKESNELIACKSRLLDELLVSKS